MASLTQWTWVWASSGRRWRTGRPGVLQSVGLQRVGQTERLSSNNKAALALLASWLFFILCLQHWTVSSRGIHRLQSYWRRGLSLTREARRVHCSFHLGWGWRVGIWPRLGQSNVSSWLESLLNDTKTTALIIRHWFNVHMGIAPSRGRQLHCLTGRVAGSDLADLVFQIFVDSVTSSWPSSKLSFDSDNQRQFPLLAFKNPNSYWKAKTKPKPTLVWKSMTMFILTSYHIKINIQVWDYFDVASFIY